MGATILNFYFISLISFFCFFFNGWCNICRFLPTKLDVDVDVDILTWLLRISRQMQTPVFCGIFPDPRTLSVLQPKIRNFRNERM